MRSPVAALRRRPEIDSTIPHSDHGTQYASWVFGQRLRATGLLPSTSAIHAKCLIMDLEVSERGRVSLAWDNAD
jgi:transposase InsO family protein